MDRKKSQEIGKIGIGLGRLEIQRFTLRNSGEI